MAKYTPQLVLTRTAESCPGQNQLLPPRLQITIGTRTAPARPSEATIGPGAPCRLPDPRSAGEYQRECPFLGPSVSGTVRQAC